MTVAIVSALPKALPAVEAEGAALPVQSAPEAASALNFSNLLLEQLAVPVTPEALPQDKPAKTGDETATTPSEPNLLLAALGAADVANRPVTGLTGAEQAARDTRPAITPLNTPLTPDRLAPETALPQVSAALLPVAQPTTAALADIPDNAEAALAPVIAESPTAKFAVRKPGTEASLSPLALTSVSTETPAPSNPQTSAIQTLAGQVQPSREAPLNVATPVRDAGWSQDFSQKIVWMATHDKQSAQMTLNPPNIGPIEITLNINKDTATAAFVSANADVREAIETALPRLREMLASTGIELGQTNVSAESFNQSANTHDSLQRSRQHAANAPLANGDRLATPSGGTLPVSQAGLGLVDTFA